MNILAHIPENKFWLDVLAKLEGRGYPVTCVLGSPKGLGWYGDEVGKRFPAAGYHDYYSTVRGELAHSDLAGHRLNFDRAARQVWEIDGHVIVEMMSRLDSRDDFSYRDRRDLFYRYLILADFLMATYELGAVVTWTQPHDAFLYTLQRLFLRRGKTVAALTVTSFDSRAFRAGEPGWDMLQRHYEGLIAANAPKAALPVVFADELDRVRGRKKEGAEPLVNRAYAEWVVATYHRGLLYKAKHLAHNLLQDVREAVIPGARRNYGALPTRFEKEPGRPLQRSFRGTFPRLRHELFSVGNKRLIRRNKRAYERWTRTPPAGPFIFVPLHYQPEMSTLPLGGAFSNQAFLLHILSACLPPGWHIVLKEHPAQHDDKYWFSCQGRRPDDYEIYASIPGVYVVPTSVSQFDLIDRCQAVATVTGSAGWEAVVRGKPAIICGDAWYKACRGVFQIECIDDCRRVMEQIVNGVTLDPRHVDLYVQALDEVGVPPYVGKDGDWAPWTLVGAGDEQREETLDLYVEQFDVMLRDGLGPNAVDAGARVRTALMG